jgi:hypothetical protein
VSCAERMEDNIAAVYVIKRPTELQIFTDFISIIDYNSKGQTLRCYTSACSHALRYVIDSLERGAERSL